MFLLVDPLIGFSIFLPRFGVSSLLLSTSSFQKIWQSAPIDSVNSDFLMSSWCLGKVTCWKLQHIYREIIFETYLAYTAITIRFWWFGHILKMGNIIPIRIFIHKVQFFFIDANWHTWVDCFCIFTTWDIGYAIGLEDESWGVKAGIKVEYWMGVGWILGLGLCRWGFEHWGEIHFHEWGGWTTAQPS